MAAQLPDRCRGGGPLDIAEMGVLNCGITHCQPILFVADGIDHLLEVVGGLFADCDDDAPARLTDARSVNG
jgi:phenylalanine-4-hydroxylase